jgi:hypothetical protein
MNQETKTDRGQAPLRQAGIALVLLFLFGSGHTALADEDLQLWSPTQIIHAITDDVSLSMQIEGRFQDDNLDDKGKGPVSGFEQLRLYAGIGRNFNEHVQVEFGYLWRYEEKRVRESLSDHALHLQVVIHTDGRLTTKPHGRDQYR